MEVSFSGRSFDGARQHGLLCLMLCLCLGLTAFFVETVLAAQAENASAPSGKKDAPAKNATAPAKTEKAGQPDKGDKADKSGKSSKASKSKASGGTVYDNQPPFTDKELVSFMEILPHFRAWAASSAEEAHPTVSKSGKPDFMYSRKAAEWVKARDWDPARFFSVMGRAAAALAIVEEGNDNMTKKPTDMPQVSESELDLVRRHLASLLRAGSDAPPILGR